IQSNSWSDHRLKSTSFKQLDPKPGVESFLTKNMKSKTFEEKLTKLSSSTVKNINIAIRSFDTFCKSEYDGRTKEEIIEEVKALKEDQNRVFRDVLQSWIDWMYKNGHLTTSVKGYISRTRRYFLHNGIRYHADDFEDPLEFKPVIKEELHELLVEEIQNIFRYANPKKIGFYLALISTGARPKELLQIRKKDIDLTQKRIKIRIEAVTSKTSSGRSVWLTKEASPYLLNRIKNKKDSDLVWATHQDPVQAEQNESKSFKGYVRKAGYTKVYKSNNNNLITLYSLRSFYFGRASSTHSEAYAHRMTGHGGYLPQYERMSDEKRLDMFLELEPEITIDDSARKQAELDKKTQENTELQKVNEMYKKTLAEKENLERQKYRLMNSSSADQKTMDLVEKVLRKHGRI
ncbi:MAG: site-specific integrase, partial [Nitrosopumilus sp.]|nr:site-specific integrase [Nitrosopumilus sp.]